MFTGVQLRSDLYFKFHDQKGKAKLEKVKDTVVNPKLKAALETELTGYSKKNMSEQELETERHLFDQSLSLDFMLESEEEDEEKVERMQSIIHREINKTPYQKVEDHKRFDGNMYLICDSVNGYIKSAIHLLSCTKKFVRFFLRANYEKLNVG
jgi:hypothetical protein